MNLLQRALAILFISALALAQAQPLSNDYCYIKDSTFGKCTICYQDCQHSAKSSFLSCSISSMLDTQTQTLTQSMCKSQCYPETYPSLSRQTPNEEQPSITLEELKKLKSETEGWTSPKQHLVKAVIIMLSSSLLFIAGFTQLWKCVDKRRKLNQLKQKQQKEWVKCFEKVNTSDTTICSLDSKEVTSLTTE